MKITFIALSFSTCLFFLSLLIGLYLHHKHRLYFHPYGHYIDEYESNRFKYYPRDFLLNVGQVPHPRNRKNYFLNFPKDKEKNTIRIGGFGDSHTYGDEVDDGADYLSILKNIFSEKMPNKKIEVLNFGNSAWSFQQSYITFLEYAKKYSIDYILIGPRGMYADRDIGFSSPSYLAHWKNWSHPKGRYVLINESEVKLVKIKGNSLRERFKNYNSLFPSWNAIKYDRNAFHVWKNYFSFINKNPFYYSKLSMGEESKLVNINLLKKMYKLYPNKILLLTSHDHTYNHYKDLKIVNTNFFKTIDHNLDLYKKFYHSSGLGNDLVASIYFNALRGREEFLLEILNCQYKKSSLPLNKQENFNSQFTEILIKSDDFSLGELMSNRSDHWYSRKNKYKIPENTKSFLGIGSGSLFTNGIYVPTPFALKEGDKISIKFKKERIILGEIEALDRKKIFFTFFKKYFYLTKDAERNLTKYILSIPVQKLNLLNKYNISHYKKAALYVNEHLLANLDLKTIYNEKRLVLELSYLNFLFTGSSTYVRHKDLPSRMPLYISFRNERRELLRSAIPNFICKKRKKRFHLKFPNFDPI